MIVGGRIAQAPYTVEDLWVGIESRFAADDVLKNVEFKSGHQFLEEYHGPDRIVFVQDDIELGSGALRAGEIGSLVDSCKAHVWGIEAAKDYGRDQGIAAKSLVIDLWGAAYLDYAANVQGGTVLISASTHVLKYGEQFVVSIRLKCPIEKVTPEKKAHIGGAETGVKHGGHSAS